MRQLFYTNYQSGHSGLSNGIMSIEIGVVLAFLTNRFLVLDGNVSPPANIVTYGDRVSNERPSRVTDLVDLPVAWGEPDGSGNGQESLELTEFPLWDFVFYYPASLDISSADAQSFAHRRSEWGTVTEDVDRIPVLRVSEEPLIPGTEYKRRNLCFYSYLFYLDDETRRSVYRLLQRMSPKKPVAELARRVAADLGSFNAVHLRRGDFKVTYGVTTLDRQPYEAVEALDNHFSREDLLVILTDERDDPFFAEIKAAYPRHLFIDHHILDAYGADFDALPHNDSLALAYLSQLVAAESQDFIGTMTSTFSAMIQRYRGNRGRNEPFKFLWNELPRASDPIEKGRHRINDCVPLDRGIMVEEHSGPYSWNRYNRRLNPAWMTEWPESFLTPQVLETGALSDRSSTTSKHPVITLVGEGRDTAEPAHTFLTFENLRVALRAEGAELRERMARSFHAGDDAGAGNVIAEFEIEDRAGGLRRLSRDTQILFETADESKLVRAVCLQVVPLFTHARRQHVWLRGAALVRDGRATVVAGDLGDEDDSLVQALLSAGWNLLGAEIVPIRVADSMVLPFCRGTHLLGSIGRAEPGPVPLTDLVVALRRPHTRDTLSVLSPSIGVAELIGASEDFKIDRDRAIKRLCQLVEKRPVTQLFFSSAASGAGLLSHSTERLHESAVG